MTDTTPRATARPKGLIQRLRGDQQGTTLAYMALAMIPIAGMIGSGVDISLAYVAKTRMQQACDAGALAGRRSMSGTNLTETDKEAARKVFFYNFSQNSLGAETMSTTDDTAANRVVVSKNAEGQLGMTATTEIPTRVMSLFGNQSIRIDVTCVGEEYYINNDIMLVMDTTGSMNCVMGAAQSCAGTTEVSGSKMSVMRSALKNLYTELKPAQDVLAGKNLRLRYGFLAYSHNVNVGKQIYNAAGGTTNYLRNPYQYRNATSPWSLKPATTHTAAWFKSTTAGFTAAEGGTAGGWNGCIEERETVNTMTASTTIIPGGAYDLDMETMPTADNLKWAPTDPAVEAAYTGATMPNATACPKPAAGLKVWNKTTSGTDVGFDNQVDTYVNGLGRTHHLAGITWGTRMLIGKGIFAASNPDIYNKVRVARTLVFLTDGYMDVSPDYYTHYGVEKAARRVSPAGTDEAGIEAIHVQRFKLMCDRAKSYGIDIWVIAILPTTDSVTDYMNYCASNAAQSIKAANSSELTSAFKKIADKVGNLRVGA